MTVVWSICLAVGIAGLVLLSWGVVYLYKLFRLVKSFHTTAKNFHNLPNHWIAGTLPLVFDIGLSGLLKYLVDETVKHKCKAVIFWRGRFFPNIYVTHSEAAGQILRTSEPKNRDFKGDYSLLLPWLGEGLIVSGGKKWERNRKLLTPAFHFKVLQPYVKVYNEATEILISKIEKVAGTGESLEVFDPVALCTLDVMLRCAFSYEDNIQEKGTLHPYVRAVKRLAALESLRDLKPYFFIDWIYYLSKEGKEFKQLCDYVHAFADEIIDKRQRELLTEPDVVRKPHLDFLDILLAAKDENSVGLSKLDMRAEVDTFLFAGHDTTASALCYAMYALAKYPGVQEKVFREVREVLGENKEVQWADLHKLSYTTMFIKEVLRMYSPVPGIGRQLSKPLVIDGVEVPAGMTVILWLYVMHHNPEVWENPEEFRPERFQEDKFASRDPYSFVPFSAGPRNCIGQNFAMNEEKVILARIVNRFRLVLDTEHEVVLVPEIVMRAKNGIKVKFYSRP